MIFDPTFLKFDGTPDTGRIPPSLEVVGGNKLTQAQLFGVHQAYEQFSMVRRLAAHDFHTERYVLPDGTRVHIWSLQNRDEVTVIPAGEVGENALPHGFAVATNWQGPLIYCRDLNEPESSPVVRWLIGPPAPQISGTAATIYDNQVFRKDVEVDEFFNLPHVHDYSSSALWDYKLWGAPDVSGTPAVPFLLKNDTTGEFAFESPHYLVQNTVVDAGGTVVYTMADQPPILAPDHPDYPEPVIYRPGVTDADGNQAGMQAMRFAVLSMTSNIWLFRLWNERIKRTADTSYAQIERNTFEMTTPWVKQTVTTVNIADNTIGEDPATYFRFKTTFAKITNASSGFIGTSGYPTYQFNTGWAGTNTWSDISAVNVRTNTSNAIRQIKNQEAGVATYEKFIVAGIATEVGYIGIERRLNYPVTIYWRGGEAVKNYYAEDLKTLFGISLYQDLPYNYRIDSASIARYDTQYDVNGSPTLTAKLGWKELLLLEGTTTGRMSGKEYQNVLGQSGTYLYIDYDWPYRRITKEIALPNDNDFNDPVTLTPYFKFVDWLNEHDVSSEYWDDYMMYGTHGGHTQTTAPQPGVKYEYPANDRPSNTAEYSLKSRYVIDYDHRGRFYAAIRCEITCTGAKWKEEITTYKGFMVKDTDPTYTVKIWFECGWGGDPVLAPTSGVNELLLAEETITRPMFEAVTVSQISPWYWNTVHIDRDVKVRTPPEPVPDEDFMMMFSNLASHQGVNPNLCCADVRPDITSTEDREKSISKDGVEYSYEENGIVTPHTKYVTGQLYARTFKLSDFYEAFWMLRQCKCHAAENDAQDEISGPLVPWFYHPVIKAALDVERHIEVRDGVIVQWSDNIPGEVSGYPPTEAAKPAANDRIIKLYRV